MLGRPSNIAYINGIKTVKNSNSSVATAKKRIAMTLYLRQRSRELPRLPIKQNMEPVPSM